MKHEFESVGKTLWAFSDGYIPLESVGPEPANTSHDRLSILNAGSVDAKISIIIYFSDQDPKGPYSITIKSNRVRQIRFNDLIDPEAIPLGVSYGCIVTSTSPIVVQFCRLDTSFPPKSFYSTSP